jgi:hypothetical protein
MAKKKEGQQIFFHPSLFLLFFDPGTVWQQCSEVKWSKSTRGWACAWVWRLKGSKSTR